MKKLFFIFLAYMSMTASSFAIDSEDELKDAMIPRDLSDTVLTSETSAQSGAWFFDALLRFVRDSIFDILVLIAIGVFLFIGARLVVARGNPEEFKKALRSFIYAAVGIFIVAIAWAAIRFIAGLDI